jgi:Cell Wall Hydrolase
MRFIAGRHATDFTPMFSLKSRDSQRVARVLPNRTLVTETPPDGGAPDPAEADHEWGFFAEEASLGTDTELRGWVEMKHISKPAPGDLPRAVIREGAFVRTCARAEVVSQGEGGDAPDTVVADFLLAWAHIGAPATGENAAKFFNNLPDFEGSDAEGPFRITSEAWGEYMTQVNQAEIMVSEVERLLPNSQVLCAAFLAQRFAEEFSARATPSPVPSDGPFIASYLNVLHCHLLGVASAFRFHQLMASGSGDALVDGVLRESIGDNVAVDRLMRNRAQLLTQSGNPVSVAKFQDSTSKLLTQAFKTARTCIQEHADYLMPPKGIGGSNAPWRDIAVAELGLWTGGGLTDASGEGRAKAIEYLRSGVPTVNERVAWCGGFVTFCLKGPEPSFASTVVKDPLWAANWVNWGSMRLRPFQLSDIPRGALIVTFALVEGTSGHVAFFDHSVTGTDKIALLGGNQSHRVTDSLEVHKNMIREIRWIETGEKSEGTSGMTDAVNGSTILVDDGPPIAATEGDVVTLARTLYGEARGETRKGIEAVANVIINRVRAKHRGNTVSQVCLADRQFSCWNHNDPNRKKIQNLDRNANAQSRLCFDIAEAAVKPGFPLHVTARTLHYFASYIRPPKWVRNSPTASFVLKEGVHLFYEGIK